MAAMTIDASSAGFQFRGYPVTIISEGVEALLRCCGESTETGLAAILHTATDTAEPDEPSGWIFQSRAVGGVTVWIERFGGMRERDRHEGGQWSVYLPSER